MTFTIISHVLHKRNSSGEIGGYGPYIREMNIWLKYVDKLVVVAPIHNAEFDAIDIAYEHNNIEFIEVPQFNINSIKGLFRLPLILPKLLCRISNGMRKADHIHLRCPGNMGLLGCFTQIFFPRKIKTAKYAGNWDWDSKQPSTYRLQQRILQNTFLTKRMTALVYGEWTGATKNIKSFFTATYSAKEIIPTEIRITDIQIKALFVGTLSSNKNPLLAVQATKALIDKGIDTELTLLGEGVERSTIEKYIADNQLNNKVFLMGNVNGERVKHYMQHSHFLLFASRSEGWPKAVAEAMFWGCLPVTTRVSCVANMVGDGSRGLLVEPNVNSMVEAIEDCLIKNEYTGKAKAAMNWSRSYTLEYFDSEIKKLLNE